MSNLIDDKELIERILDSLEEIKKEMVQLKLVSIKQEANLKEHMKRSDLLEKQIELVEKDLAPIKKHVSYIEASLKLLGLFSVIAGIIGVIIEFKKFIG